MTTTEIETEIEVKTDKEIATKKQVDIEALNEIAIAEKKQSYSHNATKFEQMKWNYAELQPNTSSEECVEEAVEQQTQNKVEYLPNRANKNNYNLKNARLKNFIICASFVLALSVGLMIYNTVQITITKMQIASIETQITTGSANYENALKQLKKLNSAEEMQNKALDLNMGETDETISAKLMETRADEPANNKTNWFNTICNFLSNLFGS